MHNFYSLQFGSEHSKKSYPLEYYDGYKIIANLDNSKTFGLSHQMLRDFPNDSYVVKHIPNKSYYPLALISNCSEYDPYNRICSKKKWGIKLYMIPVVDSLEQCNHARKSNIKEMCIYLNAYRIAYKNKDSSLCSLLKEEAEQKYCLNDLNHLIGEYRSYYLVVPEEINNVSNEVDRRDLFCGWLGGRPGCQKIKKESLSKYCLNLYYSGKDCDRFIDAEYRAECKRLKNESE